MTLHIEHAITEVIPEPEPSESGEPVDKRWTEQDKVKAAMDHWERMSLRLHAEGMDD